METGLHETVDSPAVQKLRKELTALSNQREQQKVAADGDTYRHANPTEKEPLSPVRQPDQQMHVRNNC